MKRYDLDEDFFCAIPAHSNPTGPGTQENDPEDAKERSTYPLWRDWLDLLWYDTVRYRWIRLLLGVMLIGIFIPTSHGLLAFLTTTPGLLLGVFVIAYVVLTGLLESHRAVLPNGPAQKQKTPPKPTSIDDLPFTRIEVERDRKRLTWISGVGFFLFLFISAAQGSLAHLIVLLLCLSMVVAKWTLDRLL